jgi:hypothetical protein
VTNSRVNRQRCGMPSAANVWPRCVRRALNDPLSRLRGRVGVGVLQQTPPVNCDEALRSSSRGAKRRSDPAYFLRRHGLLRFARNNGKATGSSCSRHRARRSRRPPRAPSAWQAATPPAPSRSRQGSETYPGGNRGDDGKLGWSDAPDPATRAHHASDCFSDRGFDAPLVGARDRRRRAIHVRGRCLHRQCGVPTIAAGVAAIGAAFFAIEAAASARLALFAALALFALSIMTSAAFLSWMRRAAA